MMPILPSCSQPNGKLQSEEYSVEEFNRGQKWPGSKTHPVPNHRLGATQEV